MWIIIVIHILVFYLLLTYPKEQLESCPLVRCVSVSSILHYPLQNAFLCFQLSVKGRRFMEQKQPYGIHTTDASRTALITGASRGLGLALARRLAQEGWNLVLDARGADALESVRAELSIYTRVIALPGDVSVTEHRSSLAEAIQSFGGLDVLVNNASILGPSPQPQLLAYPLDVLARVYQVNVFAPLALLQAMQHMLKPDACIINITSDAAVEGYTGWGGYGSSKAALEQISRILAAEQPELRVYWVDPGDMRTQMHQEAFPGEDISDRPLPEESIPGLIALIHGGYASGRYAAQSVDVTKDKEQ